MGTRADFYIGRGKKAKWLGSVAYDGHPENFTIIAKSKTAEKFRSAVRAELKQRNDATLPKMGWPWPWENSQTTDYAYAYEKGKVWASCFGCEWFDPLNEPDHDTLKDKAAEFPNMKAVAKPALDGGPRSGFLLLGIPK